MGIEEELSVLLDKGSLYDIDFIELPHVRIDQKFLRGLPKGGIVSLTNTGPHGDRYKISTYAKGSNVFHTYVEAPVYPPEFPENTPHSGLLNSDCRYQKETKDLGTAVQLHFDLLNYFNTHPEIITSIPPPKKYL